MKAKFYVDRLLWIFLALNILFIVLDLIVVRSGWISNGYLRRAFNLWSENNIPTWFAAVQWLMISFSAYACFAAEGTNPRRFRWFWLVIAVVFAVASMDETAALHEMIGRLIFEAQAEHLDWKQRTGAKIASFGFYVPVLVLMGISSLFFLWKRFGNNKLTSGLFVFAVFAFGISIGLDLYQEWFREQAMFSPSPLFYHNPTFYNISLVGEEWLENLGALAMVWAFTQHFYSLIGATKRSD